MSSLPEEAPATSVHVPVASITLRCDDLQRLLALLVRAGNRLQSREMVQAQYVIQGWLRRAGDTTCDL